MSSFDISDNLAEISVSAVRACPFPLVRPTGKAVNRLKSQMEILSMVAIGICFQVETLIGPLDRALVHGDNDVSEWSANRLAVVHAPGRQQHNHPQLRSFAGPTTIHQCPRIKHLLSSKDLFMSYLYQPAVFQKLGLLLDLGNDYCQL